MQPSKIINKFTQSFMPQHKSGTYLAVTLETW